MKRILIVEDEQDIQELLEAYLGDAGYETATAGDGIEAVSRFQQEAFDLVLLDVMLPKLDGFGVCGYTVFHKITGSLPGGFQGCRVGQ